jgi:hypothetical protein
MVTDLGLHSTTRKPRRGGQGGGGPGRGRIYGGTHVDGEEMPVRGPRSGLGGRGSGRGVTPWQRGAYCGVDGGGGTIGAGCRRQGARGRRRRQGNPVARLR